MHPDSVSTALATTILTIVLHHVLRTLYASKRQRSWIITALSSAVTTFGSLPFLWDVIASGGHVTALQSRYTLAAFICRLFQGLLLADLIVGCSCYPEHITIAWGIVHHTAYIALLSYLIPAGAAHCFCLAAFMELPTLHLALSFLHPRLRHDELFCALFFATRIVFHITLIFAFSTKLGMSVVQGNPLPLVFLTMALPGHVMWFSQSVRGTIRRSKRSKVGASVVVEGCPPTPAEELSSESQWSSASSDSDSDVSSPVTPTFEASGAMWDRTQVDLPSIVSL